MKRGRSNSLPYSTTKKLKTSSLTSGTTRRNVRARGGAYEFSSNPSNYRGSIHELPNVRVNSVPRYTTTMASASNSSRRSSLLSDTSMRSASSADLQMESMSSAGSRRMVAVAGRRAGARVASRFIPYIGPAIAAADLGYSIYSALTATSPTGILGATNNNMAGLRTPTSKTKGDVDKKNRKKVVKVSSKLVKQIKKVMIDMKYKGTWNQTSYAFLDRPGGNSQLSQVLLQAVNPDFSVGMKFTADEILHQASVLFNEKNDSQIAREWNNLNNMGLSNNQEGVPKETASYGCNAKFTVVDSYCKYYIRNNTQNQIHLKCYIASPKQMGSMDTTVTNRDNGVAINQNTVLMPLTVWGNSLADFLGSNLASATVNNLNAVPNACPQFNKFFSLETKIVKLEPGQDYTFTVQGPKNQELDYRKFFKNGQFYSVQKFSRGIFFSVMTDLISGGGADINKAGRFKLNSLGNLPVEINLYTKIAMPETTGIKSTATGAPIELNLRKSTYFLKTYDTVTPATLLRYDETNPQQATS